MFQVSDGPMNTTTRSEFNHQIINWWAEMSIDFVREGDALDNEFNSKPFLANLQPLNIVSRGAVIALC